MKFGIADLLSASSSDTDSQTENRHRHGRRRAIRFSSSSASSSSDDSFDEHDHGHDHGDEGSSFLDESFSSPFDVDAQRRKVGRTRRVHKSGIGEERRMREMKDSGRFGLNGGRKEEDQEQEEGSPSGSRTRQRDISSSQRDPLSPLNTAHFTRHRQSSSHRPRDGSKRIVSDSVLSSKPVSPSVKGKGKARAEDDHEEKERRRLLVDVDEWDKWDMISRQEALIKAHAETTSLSHLISESSSAAARARIMLAQKKAEEEVEEVQSMLRRLQMGRLEEDRKREEAFQVRRKGLWDSIEQSIRAAEQAEAAALAKANREKQEALAREAERRRSDEEAKARAEAEARAEAARKAEEEEAAARAKEDEERAARLDAEKEAGEGLISGLSVKRLEWVEWAKKMKEVKDEVIERLKADEARRKAISRTKRSITVRIGQVVNTRQSIVSITDNIHQQISAYLPSPPTAVQPLVADLSTLPLEYTYLLSHVSKALIKQAEAEINAKPEAAYPLAKITVGLMLRGHAVFGSILMARLVKKCCWVIPYYPAKQQGQPDADYRKSVGHKELSPPESDVQYASRMAGILTLYFAITSTSLGPLLQTTPTPPTEISQLDVLIPSWFRISACWSWLAGICRPAFTSLRPVPVFITVALETMGPELGEAYGLRQVGKVVTAILREGLGMGGDGEGTLAKENVAGKASLKLFLQPVLEQGSFPVNEAKVWEV